MKNEIVPTELYTAEAAESADQAQADLSAEDPDNADALSSLLKRTASARQFNEEAWKRAIQ